MPITANVTNEQITASVGETQIDVTVSGGVGPTGAAGASAWNDITGKPSTFAPSAHAASHAAGGADGLTPADIGAAAAPSGDYENPSLIADGALALWDFQGGTPWVRASDGVVLFGTGYAGAMLTAIGAASLSHQHSATADLTFAGAAAGQVLKVNSTASGLEWGSAAADVSIDTTAADILSATSGAISADDPGADRLVFWDDSAGKLTHLTVGTGLTITDTTITSAGSTSASDLTSGTLGFQRLPARVRSAASLYLWSSFR